MDSELIYKIIEYICVFLALLLVLPLHEFAHAFVAVKFGDNTPKLYGRYTLNPLAHFDIPGLIFFVFAHFGWAKPVPVNPYNFKKYKLGSFCVAIAGVTMNFLLAFFAYPLFYLALKYLPDFGYFDEVIIYTLDFIMVLGLNFFVFNLLPIYPLDGFRVVDSFSKKKSPVYFFLRNYGQYVLMGLILLGIIADYTGNSNIDILGRFISICTGYLLEPISLFWGLIF